MKLLVIEDDPQTATLMHKGLTSEGFAVEICGDGETGLKEAASGQHDMVILDVGLPKMDGWSVLTRLRETQHNVPVVMLTARDAVESRVQGLSLGADDYLVKPFAFSELVARIRTVMRRLSQGNGDSLAFEDLRLDFRRHRVYREATAIDLSGKEFELLELLLRHQGNVLSRAFISEHVWNMSVDCDSNVVDVNIRRLRAKIDDPFERKYIHTVRGRGYVIR
jgi:two-component system, OmpR family, copper resistance phosphate regulon response regulator CusR